MSIERIKNQIQTDAVETQPTCAQACHNHKPIEKFVLIVFTRIWCTLTTTRTTTTNTMTTRQLVSSIIRSRLKKQPRISSIHGDYPPSRNNLLSTSIPRYYYSSRNTFYHNDDKNSSNNNSTRCNNYDDKRLEVLRTSKTQGHDCLVQKYNYRSYSSTGGELTKKVDDDLVVTSKDGVVGKPIDFDVNSKIEGNESQIVTITLEPNQVLRAESGAMMYMVRIFFAFVVGTKNEEKKLCFYFRT